MRFRYFNIPKLVFQLLRPNYSVRYDYDPDTQPNLLNNLYRLCLAICYVIESDLQEYYSYRIRWYMLVSCDPTYGSVEYVLNYLWDYNSQITITPSSVVDTTSYLYTEDTPAVYLYTEDQPEVYWGMGREYSGNPIVNIPAALANSPDYQQFIAELNLLFPFYIPYTINII